MTTRTKVTALPTPPDWRAAERALRDGADAAAALRATLRLPPEACDHDVLAALAGMPQPTITIYTREATAYIAGAPGVPEGKVYAEMRDHCAARAADDPQMREVKRRHLLATLERMQAEGPPRADDEAFWRDLDADLAKMRPRL